MLNLRQMLHDRWNDRDRALVLSRKKEAELRAEVALLKQSSPRAIVGLLMPCPHCGEYTPLHGGFIDAIGQSGSEDCRCCNKRFYYDIGRIHHATGKEPGVSCDGKAADLDQEIADLNDDNDALKREVEALTKTLADVALVAHYGGFAQLDEMDAVRLIRHISITQCPIEWNTRTGARLLHLVKGLLK